MTDNEIKDLAKKVAKILYDEDKSYNGILWWSNEPKERKAEELEMVLEVLLRDHCIVSREKVKEIYGEYEKNFDDHADNCFAGGTRALEDLFGSDLFQEGGEE